MSIYFREKTSPEIGELVKKNALVILPVGTIEEHGPHLCVDADVSIAEDISREIGEMMKNEIPLVVMPAVWSGYTAAELRRWPGTIIVGTRTFADMVSDVCRSLIDMGFRKIMMVDCHGQHKPLLNMVCKEVADDTGVYMTITAPVVFSRKAYEEHRKTEQGGSCHAGEWETSVLLYYNRPVHMEKAPSSDALRYHSDNVAGDATRGSQRVVWSTWGIQRSESGVYGDPTTATAGLGKIIVEEIKAGYREFMLEFYNHDRDRV
ncbi:MAG TPA: creatininase family protein [Clostridia bacterium]|nr:creatininase family protein [Clostridia bacterium]HPQ46771.1 creatininase family protein [Clostridia bacterium]